MLKSWYNCSVGHQPVPIKLGDTHYAPRKFDRLAISSLKKQNRRGCTETRDEGDGQSLPINKLLNIAESVYLAILISFLQYYALKLSSIAKLIPGTIKFGDKKGCSLSEAGVNGWCNG
ncbi:MAG: hypothetical protein CMI54_07215 [Parcubacteria group bacterium]|jgi:hypothetical protein|nr:hypothetical protein [Parcubacteria group bacterium]|tara:strand:+ start:10988 stop:11341 length:354 start_codon:yes stop_codon:yes gene_type:complete